MGSRIPFHQSYLSGQEVGRMQEAIVSGALGADGVYTERCHRFMESTFSAKRALLTTSCTTALEMAAVLLAEKGAHGHGLGAEVILPSFTFVSTANAFLVHGYKPVFIDVCEDTQNMDPALLDEAYSNRTRIVVPVHYAGLPANMDAIGQWAKERGVFVVEDAAQAFSSKIGGRFAGTLGAFGAYSFHNTKNYICGEGGALLVNDSKYVDRAEFIREKGTNRRQFLRGAVDKYTWVDVGGSYLPAEPLAAFLSAQFDCADTILANRRRIYQRYVHALSPLVEAGRFRIQKIPKDCEPNFHIFYVLVNSPDVREALRGFLAEREIDAVSHYVPLHSSPMGKTLSEKTVRLPVTESVAERVLRLPIYPGLSDQDVDRVCDAVFAFFKRG